MFLINRVCSVCCMGLNHGFVWIGAEMDDEGPVGLGPVAAAAVAPDAATPDALPLLDSGVIPVLSLAGRFALAPVLSLLVSGNSFLAALSRALALSLSNLRSLQLWTVCLPPQFRHRPSLNHSFCWEVGRIWILGIL